MVGWKITVWIGVVLVAIWFLYLVRGILLPFAIAGSLAGVWLVKRISGERFYPFVYALMIVAGAKLLWDGLAGF